MEASFFLEQSLRRRRLFQEELDDTELSNPRLRTVLEGLRRVHAAAGTARKVWKQIRAWAWEHDVQTLRVADIGCGSGAVLRSLSRRARRDGFNFEGIGIDRNPNTITFAREQHCLGVTYRVGNALDCDLQGFNVIISTMFLHHLRDRAAIGLLRRIAEASEGLVIVHDLVRSRVTLHLARLLTRVASTDPILYRDGMRSVLAAFTESELAHLAGEAGMRDAVLRRHWPCQISLRWKRSIAS